MEVLALMIAIVCLEIVTLQMASVETLCLRERVAELKQLFKSFQSFFIENSKNLLFLLLLLLNLLF